MSELFVNFEETIDLVDVQDIKEVKSNKISKYIKDNKIIEYNDTTTQFYRVLRERKLDVINQNEIEDPNTMFKFEYRWDPYTGEREDKDPYGPLYFHPDDLIYCWYLKRLNGLWVEPKDEASGYFSGYYDFHVGTGKNIEVIGRGTYPESYLFRLPVNDCYLMKDQDLSIVTMGPELTNDEIFEIYNLAEKYHKNNYKLTYKKNRPNLMAMKEYYDIALDKSPKVLIYQKDKTEQELKIEANRCGVELLKNV